MASLFPRVVVIGASAGGVSALLKIAAALPAHFPAPICIVQHIGGHVSLLPELLRYRGANHAVHPGHGQQLASGTLHVAPPDEHLLLDGDRLLLTRGPKENHARPAIDPLFRSAALSHGARAIGVILTGFLDDGAAGLKAIAERGGTTIVQDPDNAAEPEMPRSALASVAADHCVPLDEIAPLLVRLAGTVPAPATAPAPLWLEREVEINRGDGTMEQLEGIATPSTLTCPDCSGTLWEMNDAQPLRYRCHTGHAFSSLSLANAQKDAAEEALWSSVRALRERELLLRRLAAIAEATGDAGQAEAGRVQAQRLAEQVATLQQLAHEAPPAIEIGVDDTA